MGKALGVLAVLAVGIVVVGCGGGSTTVVETTVIKEDATPPTTTYLPASGFQSKFVEPRQYSFYVDGAVLGDELTWRRWGSASAVATGTIDIRDPTGEGAEDRLRFPGSVEASGREECRGAYYYTKALAILPPRSPYHPEGPMPLSTPCNEGGPPPQVPAPPEMPAPSASAGAGPSSSDVYFEAPSGNINCVISNDGATCEIRHKSYVPSVPKPSDCMTDYGHRLSVDTRGVVTFDCYGDSMSGIAERVLGYGDFLTRGRMTCHSLQIGMTCGTQSGAFTLSEQSVIVE